jgi:phosphoenolpyruvate carboxylase
MYPILATGSLPFRGHLRPENIENFLEEYSGFKTFAFQSSMKYDFEEKDVRKTVKKIKEHKMKKKTLGRDEMKDIGRIIDIFSTDYKETIVGIAPIINNLSIHVPSRRTRSLHIGLFGYSRQLVKGIHLPRAIEFTSTLYSLGLPPEIIGLRSLEKIEKEGLKDLLFKNYTHLKDDVTFASRYLCESSINELKKKELLNVKTAKELKDDLAMLKGLKIKRGPQNLQDENHILLSKMIVDGLGKLSSSEMTDVITKAAQIRKSLG